MQKFNSMIPPQQWNCFFYLLRLFLITHISFMTKFFGFVELLGYSRVGELVIHVFFF